MLYKKLKRLSRSLEEADKIALRLQDIIKKEASCLGRDFLCCYHSHYKIPVYSVYTSSHLVHGAGINITICIKKGKFELFEDKNIGEDRDKALDLINRLNRMLNQRANSHEQTKGTANLSRKTLIHPRYYKRGFLFNWRQRTGS